MKKKNLNIKQLSVRSFVTELDQKTGNTVKGGWTVWPCTWAVCEQGATNPGDQTCN